MRLEAKTKGKEKEFESSLSYLESKKQIRNFIDDQDAIAIKEG
jgi:hypothetical protein